MESNNYIKGKIVDGVQFNAYLTLYYFCEMMCIDTDSLCCLILEKIGSYRDIESINSITIVEICHSRMVTISSNNSKQAKVSANIISKKGFKINREYFIEVNEGFIKRELRDMKLKKLEI